MHLRTATACAVIAALAAVSFGVHGGLAKNKVPTGPKRVLVLDGSPVHNIGELKLHMSNWGMFGSWPGTTNPFSFAPSGEWPGGSGIEHVFTGGLWVGALRNSVPAVSTASYQFEFRPTQDPIDIVYRSAEGAAGGNRLPWPGADDDNDGTIDEDPLDGHDNDLDGQTDEDFAAISDQMFARWYTDNQPEAIQIYPEHNPLDIEVREHTYQWDDDEFDDFIGLDFEITNIGVETLEDIFVGVFLDGDVGNRNTPNYWEDDIAGFRNFPFVCTPYGGVALRYGYICDGTGSCIAALILNHTTDPTGQLAPPEVRWTTFANFSGTLPYDQGGDPTNDFERYELMSSETIERDGTVPRDYRILVSTGPFSSLAPGETLRFTIALVGLPTANSTDNPSRAAIAYRGQWFDLDEDPTTGVEGRETPVPGPVTGIVIDACRPPFDQPIDWNSHEPVWINADCEKEDFFKSNCGYSEADSALFRTGVAGKEYQAHWMLPGSLPPTAVSISRFDARVEGTAVKLEWQTWADEEIAGFELLRATGAGEPRALVGGYLPGDMRTYVDRSVAPGARYEYVLVAHGVSGWTAVSPRAGVNVPRAGLALSQNTPNPFNASTTITFTLPERAVVDLAVYDAAGRRVATLATGVRPAGGHEITWDGTDDAGRRVGTGVYFYKLDAAGQAVTRKIAILR
jgi:hypothetical protein